MPHPSIRRWKPVRHPLASLPFSASRLHPTTTNTLTNDTSCSRAHWNSPATYLYLPGASRRSLESDVCWLILNKYLLHVIPEKPLHKVEASQPAQTWGAWRRAGRDVLHKGHSMNSTAVVRDNVVDPATTKAKEAVVVEVDQTAIPSPGTHEEQWEPLGIVTMDGIIVEESNPASAEISRLERHVTHSACDEENRPPPSPRLSRSTSLSVLSKGSKRRANSSPKKDKGLRLPSFKGLGISSWEPRPAPTQPHNNGQQHELLYQSRPRRSDPRPRPLSYFQHASEPVFRSAPLLTPPEDHDSIKWNNALLFPSAPSTFRTTQIDAPYSSALNTSQAAMTDRSGLATGSLSSRQEGSQSLSAQFGSRDAVSNNRTSNDERWFDVAIEEAGMQILAPCSDSLNADLLKLGCLTLPPTRVAMSASLPKCSHFQQRTRHHTMKSSLRQSSPYRVASRSMTSHSSA